MDLSNIENLFFELLKIRSDTGTPLERDVEDYIFNYLSSFNYFKEHPNHYGKLNLGDAFNREVIWGLVKGTSNKTVILLHHHDVVDSLDYGAYEKYAYLPNDLKKAYKSLEFPKEITDDLNSDHWIFGRGSSDMKAGAAIQLEILKNFSEQSDFEGNLLLLSVPDEETFSGGMRRTISFLNTLREQFDLSYELLINSEPHEREDQNTGSFYDGSVGKIMPVVYVQGYKSHIGQIFSGFNPLLLLSRIAISTETNMAFSEEQLGETSPPPSWSYLRDFKQNYDASIPEAAGGYFSVLTLNQTPKDILNKLKRLSEEAFTKSIEQLNNNYKAFTHSHDQLPWQPKVKYFSEIYEEARQHGKEVFEHAFNHTIEKIKQDLQAGKTTVPNSNFTLIKKTLEYIPNNDPVVVIGISPPYYPHVSNENLILSRKIQSISKVINNKSKEFGETYTVKKYFMGISDLSYTSLHKSDETVPYIENNMPLWGHVYDINFKELKKLKIPVINLGPWGKDLHKRTERVYAKDLCHNTPKLVTEVIDHILSR